MAQDVKFYKIKEVADAADKTISELAGTSFSDTAFFLNTNDDSLYLGNRKLSNTPEINELKEIVSSLYDFQRTISIENEDGSTTTETIDYNEADKDKSIREIAIEELSYQLVPESAKESMDTLAEIAAWIQYHPEDAAAMNEAIEQLKKDVDQLKIDLLLYIPLAGSSSITGNLITNNGSSLGASAQPWNSIYGITLETETAKANTVTLGGGANLTYDATNERVVISFI